MTMEASMKVQIENNDYESKKKLAIELMQKKLFQYIVNSIITAGYKTLEVIATMDISRDSPSNFIHEIEEFCNSQGNSQISGPIIVAPHTASSNGCFRFPPAIKGL